MEVLPWEDKAKLLVEAGEVLEAEGSHQVCIMLLEEAFDRGTVSLEALVELNDPVLEDHFLIASLGLKFSCAVLDELVESTSRYFRFFVALAFIWQRIAQLLY